MNRVVSLGVVVAVLGVAGCSNTIRGHVYLDSNNNSQLDAGEKGVENARFSVTRDGGVHGDGRTGVKGEFLVRANESGKYCITVDRNAIIGKESSKPLLSVVPVIPGTTPKSTSATMAMKTLLKAVGDSYGTPSTPPAPGTTTVSALSGCVQVATGNEDINVPVQLDFAAAIEELQALPELKVAPGDALALKLTWPESCELQNIPIPDVFISLDADVGIVGDTSPKLDFSAEIIPESVSRAADLTQDGLATKTVQLKVRHDASGGKQQFTIQPKVRCPNDAVFSLPKQGVTLVAKPILVVSQNLKGTVALGATLMDEITITNHSGKAQNGVKVLVSFSNMVTALKALSAENCNHLGNSMSCLVNLAVGEKKTLTLSFTLPNKLDEKEEMAITATAKLEADEGSFEADRINFWLQP